VKRSTAIPQASHLNSGTAVPRDELAWPSTRGRVLRTPTLHFEVDPRAVVTPYGGLALVEELCRSFDVAQIIDEHVHVLKQHQPFHESDHILAQVFNLYVGGSTLEDLASLQHDEALRRMLGACRLPDPTTAGDFLRRFTPESLDALRTANTRIQRAVWRKLARRHRWPRGKRPRMVVYLDGHIKELYGASIEGADFSYTGKWSYQALTVTLAGTGECLAVRLRPGNMRSSEGAASVLDEVLPWIKEHAEDVLVVADSDFDRSDVRQACVRAGVYFAFVGREQSDRPEMADSISEWRTFRTRAARQVEQRRGRKGYRSRKRRPNLKRQRARERKFTELRLVRQFVGETSWTPRGTTEQLRLVVRRQLIDRHEPKQGMLFEQFRDRYIVTNLPASWAAEEVIDATYERCDQENVIEQLGSGLAMWRMPVKQFIGNEVWMEIARLAWNMRSWIAQLALPEEVVRWEWKRFRHAFVYLAAEVVHHARQILVRFAASHRFAPMLLHAHQHL